MTDTLVLQRILHDAIIEPIPEEKTSYTIYILVAAVILVTLLLIRYILRKKASEK